MKKLILLFVFAIVMTNVFGTAYSWNGGDGSWATTSAWNPTAPTGGPTTTDDVTINSASSISIALGAARTVKSITFSGGGTVTLTATSGQTLTTTDMTTSNPVIFSADQVTIITSLTFNGGSSKITHTPVTAGKAFILGNGNAFTLSGNNETNCFDGNDKAQYNINTTSALTAFFNPNNVYYQLIINKGIITLGADFQTNRLSWGSAPSANTGLTLNGKTLTLSSANPGSCTLTANNAFTIGIDASVGGSKVVISTTQTSFLNATGRIFKDLTTIDNLEMNSTGTFIPGYPLTVKNLILTAGTVSANNITIASGGSITRSTSTALLTGAPVFTGAVNVTTGASTATAGSELLGRSGRVGTLTVNNSSTYTLNASTGIATTTSITSGGLGYGIAPAVTFNTPSGGAAAIGTAFITNGAVTAINITSGGSGYISAPTITIAAPPTPSAWAGSTSYTLNTTVTNGGNLYVCSTIGTSAPSSPTSWLPSTSYSVNDLRKNGTNIYICTTAGTSAASGGPTGTGTGISDGTNTKWSYYGANTGPSGIGNGIIDGVARWNYLGLAANVATATATATYNSTNTLTVDALTVGNGTSGTVNYPNSANALTLNVNNDITINSGASFLCGTQGSAVTHLLNVGGNITNSGIFTPVSATGKAVDVTLNGTSANQNLCAATFNNLTINNTASSNPGATLTGAVTVNNVLAFTAGKLTLGANNLTIGSSGSISGASSSNYIVTNGAGLLSQTVSASTPKTFPIGASTSSYDPTIVNPVATLVYSASVGSTLSGTPTVSSYANSRQWNIVQAIGTPTATITLTPSTATNTSNPVIGNYNGAVWTESVASLTGTSFTGTYALGSTNNFATGSRDAFFTSSRYWVGGASGNWDVANNWSYSSGGISGAPIPVVTNDVYFDNSGSNANPTVTLITAIGNAAPSATQLNSLNFTNSNVTFSGAFGVFTNNMTLNSSQVTFVDAVGINTSLSFLGTSPRLICNAASGGKNLWFGNGNDFTLNGNSATNYIDGNANLQFNFYMNNLLGTSSAFYFNPATTYYNFLIQKGIIPLGTDVKTNRIAWGSSGSNIIKLALNGKVLTITGPGGGTTTNASSTVGIDASISGSKVVIVSSHASILNASGRIFYPATTIDNLEINTSGTFISGYPLTVKNLILTAGKISTGSNILTVEADGSVTGASSTSYIQGNLKKLIAAGSTSKTFEIGDATSYAPLTLALSGTIAGSTGSIQASTAIGEHANIATSGINATKSVNRTWNITNPDALTGLTSYSPTFTFVAGDVIGGASTGNFIVGKYASSAWTLPTVGTKTATTTQANGVSDFGDFAIGEANISTPTPTVTVTPIGTYTYNGSPQGPIAATNTGTGASYTFSYVGTGGTSYTASATLPTNAGTYTATATVAAHGSYSEASSSATAFTIAKVTLTITADNQSVVYGTATATVTGVGTYTPTGFVNSETESVISGSATYSTTYTNTTVAATSGVTITPVVTGLTAANYSFTAANGAITVSKASQFITFNALPTGKKVGDADFAPDATSATSGTNVITYSSSKESVATIVDGKIHLVGAGECTIYANQASSTNYNAATQASRSLTVDAANNTINIATGTTQDASIVFTSPTADVTVAGTNTVVNVDVTKTVNSLTISSAGKVTVSNSLSVTDGVTVAPNATLDLSNTLAIGGDLTLKADQTSTFSVKVGSPMTITGKVKFLKTMDDTKWYFMAFPCNIPLSDIKLNGNSFILGTDLFIKYYSGSNRASNGPNPLLNWIQITDDHLTANQGYIFGLPDKAGDHNLSVITFTLDKNVLKSEADPRGIAVNYYQILTNVENNRGWNLVGQPYLSKYASQAGANILNLYRFNGSTYDFYAKNTSTLPEVNPFEAYFTQVTAGLQGTGLTFGLAARQSAPASVAVNQSDLVRLNISTSTGTDKTYLIMDDLQSTNYQIGEDLEKMITTETTFPQVYSVLGGINYANNALPVYNVQNLPIGFYTQTAGSTTISVDATKATSLSKLLLTDNSTNPATVTDLLISNYTFIAAAGTNNSRFTITAQRIPTINGIETDNDTNAPTLVINNSKLVINNLDGKASVRIFDALGRMVANKMVSNNSLEINLSAKGMYTVQIEVGGKNWVKKIVF